MNESAQFGEIAKSFKIYQINFKDCYPVHTVGEIQVYKGIKKKNQEEYYIAEKGEIRAFSKKIDKAVRNISFLEQQNKLESKPLDLKQYIDIDFFVFMYKSESVACSDVKPNILAEIESRKIQKQDRYTFQQLLCFAMHRFNFEYFKLYLLNTNQHLSNIPHYNNCQNCKLRLANECSIQMRQK